MLGAWCFSTKPVSLKPMHMVPKFACQMRPQGFSRRWGMHLKWQHLYRPTYLNVEHGHQCYD